MTSAKHSPKSSEVSSDDLSSTSSASASASPSPSPSPAPATTTTTTTTTGSETHTCPYDDCKKSFSKKYNLKAHLRLHTGEQPFQCERPDCRKKFKWRSSLSSHSIWHTRKDHGSISSPGDSKATDASKKDLVPKFPSSPAAAGVAKSTSPSKAKSQDAKQGKSVVPTSTANTSAPTKSESTTVAAASSINKKKRPRNLSSRKGKTPASTVPSSSSTDVSSDTVPSLTDFCFSTDTAADSKTTTTKTTKRKTSRPASKKRRTSDNKDVKGEAKMVEALSPPAVDADLDIFSSPGSPVTSESGLSEHSLGMDLFSCDAFPSLMGSEGEPLSLGTEDVEALLSGVGDDGMFGYVSPSCATLSGLDTRFGTFDLDSFPNFCMGKVDRL